MCVVIGLQSTGEANTSAAREMGGDELDDYVSAPLMIARGYLEGGFPLDANGKLRISDRELDILQYQVLPIPA
jgi:hypothetical protein